ncbi:MAG TPA: phosphatidate cytidylyltransferase [Actinomycetota bacterium]|nr:phosphatidate cytidylyltransferase [Actinomycetota bacterium]
MPEGENHNDLFEDLDKFFAPIQDVDWPETSPPRRERTTEEQGAPEEPVRIPEEEPPAGPDAEGEGLFGEAETAGAEDQGAVRGAEPEEEEEELLDEGSAPTDLDIAEAPVPEPISVESFTRPPDAYVDLPGMDEEIESATPAELDEGEEAPTPEAVEAAAEHFAASVRDEAITEPGSEPQPVGTDVPTTTLPDLFGDEEEPTEEELPPVRAVRVGAEGLGGPSWQEPTAVEVGADQEPRRTGRNVPAAFLTGLALALLAGGSIAIGKGAFAIVAGVIVLWAQGELYRALQKEHHQPATALGLVSGGLVLAGAYFRGEAAMLSMFVLSIFATFLWYMTVPASHRRGAAGNLGLTVLGVAYVPLLAGYALTLFRFPEGRAVTISVIGLAFLYDTAAFAVGSLWGSRPLASTVSPKKSVEGAIGATLVVIAVAIGVVPSSVAILDTIPRAAGLALVVAVFALLGDLAESLLKRDLGLKDMGSILPGHGGVLDRIDSILFVVPAAYFFLRLILL